MPGTPHRAASSPIPPLPSISGHLDPGSHQRVLMKTGLILLIIGHLNFITGALVHGTVLRFVVNARDAISLQYAVANAASVISALLVPGAMGCIWGRCRYMEGGQEVGRGRMWDGCGMDVGWMQGGQEVGCGRMWDGHCSISPSLLEISLSSTKRGG